MSRKIITRILVIFGIVAFVVAIAIVVLMMNERETRFSTQHMPVKQTMLQCTAATPIAPFFFTSENTNSPNYTFKFLYNDDDITSASFTYKVSFASSEVAADELSRMQIKYYQYIEKTNISSNNLTPVFYRNNDDISISLYFEDRYLLPNISDLLSLTKDEATRLKEYDVQNLKEIYDSKGFACEHNEYNN